MTITTEGRHLVAGEVGRLITFEDIDFDWAGEGHTLWYRVWASDDDEDYEDYQMTALADPESGLLTTTAAIWPEGKGYRSKLVSKLAGVDQFMSEDFTMDIKP